MTGKVTEKRDRARRRIARDDSADAPSGENGGWGSIPDNISARFCPHLDDSASCHERASLLHSEPQRDDRALALTTAPADMLSRRAANVSPSTPAEMTCHIRISSRYHCTVTVIWRREPEHLTATAAAARRAPPTAAAVGAIVVLVAARAAKADRCAAADAADVERLWAAPPRGVPLLRVVNGDRPYTTLPFVVLVSHTGEGDMPVEMFPHPRAARSTP